MAGKRSPESFIKRQREKRKQEEAREKLAKRRERNALKRDAKKGDEGSDAQAPADPNAASPSPPSATLSASGGANPS